MDYSTMRKPQDVGGLSAAPPWETITTYLLSILTGAYFLLKALELLGYPVWYYIRVAGQILAMESVTTRLLDGVKSLVKNQDVPAGLQNSKVFCYQNSITQGFAAIPSLNNWLQDFTARLGGSSEDSPVSFALQDIVKRLNDNENNGTTFNLDRRLKEVGGFDEDEQQDSHEYLLKVVEKVDDEAKKALKKKRIETFSWSEAAKVLLEKSDIKHERFPGLFPSFPPNPLNGMTAKRVTCLECGYYGQLQHEEFHALTLNLGTDTSYDISKLFDEFTKVETMSDVNCPNCTLNAAKASIQGLLAKDIPEQLRDTLTARLETINTAIEDGKMEDETLVKTCGIQEKLFQKQQKTLQTVVSRPPKALAIHLQRIVFDERLFRQYKNNAPVNYPEFLDIAPWTLNSSISADPASPLMSLDTPGLNYQLRAVVCHAGTYNYGHYICFRKRPTWVKEDGKPPHQIDTWFQYSDANVMPVNEPRVMGNGQATLLLYERIPDPPTLPTQTVDDCLTESRPVLKRGRGEIEDNGGPVDVEVLPSHPAFEEFRPLPAFVSAT
ncbi:cysteine proteinase [Amniculicola lignicola CBS 123094]|uniref:ubiquitinyl hydrolase 1 n=1 Tax=Amniculicola lignicola CBS 123094 TaxID=1392246 RepID=A0A6A5X1P3_9PLEO|nr:cysteine proteinase [Amniculicola lignicola CBS 123094]